MLMDALLLFRILNSFTKMMTYYLRDKNELLRYHTLCTGILKCGSPTKGIKLTRFVLFETNRIRQL